MSSNGSPDGEAHLKAGASSDGKQTQDMKTSRCTHLQPGKRSARRRVGPDGAVLRGGYRSGDARYDVPGLGISSWALPCGSGLILTGEAWIVRSLSCRHEKPSATSAGSPIATAAASSTACRTMP